MSGFPRARRVPRMNVGPPGCMETLESRRLMAAGDLDPSFGNGGKLVVDLNTFSETAADVAVAGDGGILIAGTLGNRYLLAKFLGDGSPDSSFGTGGHAGGHLL